MEIDPNAQYRAVIATTAGSFTIELLAKESPVAVNNFVFLARQGFFEGDQFFRVLKTFVLQTGDPLNNGTGGPGYQWDDELPIHVPYGPGIIAMANAGPNTNGSQFFVCTGADSAGLNRYPNYTQFGRVIDGMSVVETIADGKVEYNPRMQEVSRPVDPVTVESVTIEELPATAGE
jgi:cyclophilin family peptidyl-prolyl cis-trans isomerase